MGFDKFPKGQDGIIRTEEPASLIDVKRDQEKIAISDKADIRTNLDILKDASKINTLIFVGETQKERVNILNFAIEEMKKEGIQPEQIESVEDFKKKVKSYQKAHNLEVDGKIGSKTYKEMYIGEILHRAKKGTNILKETGDDVLEVLQNEDPELGVNYLALLDFMKYFFDKPENKSNPKYEYLITGIEKISEKNKIIQKKGEEAIKEGQKKRADGTSFFGDFIKVLEGEMTMQEFLAKNKGRALVGTIIAFLFFGNKIPGFKELPGSGSVLGRVGWLFLGSVTGAGELFNYGADKLGKAWSASGEYISKRVNSDASKNAKESIKKVLANPGEHIGGLLSDVAEFFKNTPEKATKLIGDAISASTTTVLDYNNGLDTAKKLDVDVLSSLQEKLFADERFLNTKTEELANITDIATLNSYASFDFTGLKITDENGEGVTGKTLTDDDVKKYMTNHIKKIVDSKDEYVKNAFISEDMRAFIEKGKQVLSGGEGSYSENTELNEQIRTEIADIHSGAPNAAKALSTAILAKNVDSFNFESHKSELSKQGDKVQKLIEKAKYIEEGEKKIQSAIEGVNKITLNTDPNIGETETTLVDKLKKVDKILHDFSIEADHGITEDQLGKQKLVAAVNKKQKEIIDYGVNKEIPDFVAKKREIEEELKTDEALVELKKMPKGSLPAETAAISEFTDYLDENTNSFKKAEELQAQYEDKTDTKSKGIKKEIERVLKNKDRYAVRLLSKISGIKTSLDTFSNKIPRENSGTLGNQAFIKELQRLSNLSNEFRKLAKKDEIETLLTTLNKALIDVNGVEGVKTKIGVIKVGLKQAVEKAKTDFDITVTVPSDISEKDELVAAVDNIKDKEKIIAGFNSKTFNIDLTNVNENFKFSVDFDWLGTDETGEIKTRGLEAAKKDIKKLYTDAISSATTGEKIRELAGEYNNLVIEKGVGSMDDLEKAIEEKTFELFKGELALVNNIQDLKNIKIKYKIKETGMKIFENIPGVNIVSDKYYQEMKEKLITIPYGELLADDTVFKFVNKLKVKYLGTNTDYETDDNTQAYGIKEFIEGIPHFGQLQNLDLISNIQAYYQQKGEKISKKLKVEYYINEDIKELNRILATILKFED